MGFSHPDLRPSVDAFFVQTPSHELMILVLETHFWNKQKKIFISRMNGIIEFRLETELR